MKSVTLVFLMSVLLGGCLMLTEESLLLDTDPRIASSSPEASALLGAYTSWDGQTLTFRADGDEYALDFRITDEHQIIEGHLEGELIRLNDHRLLLELHPPEGTPPADFLGRWVKPRNAPLLTFRPDSRPAPKTVHAHIIFEERDGVMYLHLLEQEQFGEQSGIFFTMDQEGRERGGKPIGDCFLLFDVPPQNMRRVLAEGPLGSDRSIPLRELKRELPPPTDPLP
jgi:hypothetical protein